MSVRRRKTHRKLAPMLECLIEALEVQDADHRSGAAGALRAFGHLAALEIPNRGPGDRRLKPREQRGPCVRTGGRFYRTRRQAVRRRSPPRCGGRRYGSPLHDVGRRIHRAEPCCTSAVRPATEAFMFAKPALASRHRLSQ